MGVIFYLDMPPDGVIPHYDVGNLKDEIMVFGKEAEPVWSKGAPRYQHDLISTGWWMSFEGDSRAEVEARIDEVLPENSNVLIVTRGYYEIPTTNKLSGTAPVCCFLEAALLHHPELKFPKFRTFKGDWKGIWEYVPANIHPDITPSWQREH